MTSKERNEYLFPLLDVPPAQRMVDGISAFVLKNPEFFPNIMELMFNNPGRVGRHAAWAATKCVEKENNWIIDYIPEIVHSVRNFEHPAFQRQCMKMLSLAPLPENLIGELFDICVEFYLSDLPTAVKIFSMQVMYNISRMEPELKPELIDLIESRLEYGTAGYINRGKRLLKTLYKECRRT